MERGDENVDDIVGGGIMGEHRRRHSDKIRVRVEIENMYQSNGLWQRLGRLKRLGSLRSCEGFDIYILNP